MEVAPEKIGVPVSESRGKIKNLKKYMMQPWSHLFTQSVTRMIILGRTLKKKVHYGGENQGMGMINPWLREAEGLSS